MTLQAEVHGKYQTILTHCDENPKPLKLFLGYVTHPSHWCNIVNK